MEQAVHLSASDPRLMRRLARMYLELNMLDEAEGQVAMAMEADRTSAEVWALQGDCRFRRNDHLARLRRIIVPGVTTGLSRSAVANRRTVSSAGPL